MVLAPATPSGVQADRPGSVLPGTVRAYPALDAGFLYVRNDDTLVCLDLRRPMISSTASRPPRAFTGGQEVRRNSFGTVLLNSN